VKAEDYTVEKQLGDEGSFREFSEEGKELMGYLESLVCSLDFLG